MSSEAHDQNKPRITSIGGVFIKSQDPKSLLQWYQQNFEIKGDDYGFSFAWKSNEHIKPDGHTLFSIFPESTDYFGQQQNSYMLNFRVHNLSELIETLRNNGVEVYKEIENYPYGSFAQIKDPEGRLIELWEPNDDAYAEMVGSLINKC